MLKNDTNPPLIEIKKDIINQNLRHISGNIIDNNPVELKIISGSYNKNAQMEISKIEKMPVNVGINPNEPHSFDFDWYKSDLYLVNGGEKVKVAYFDVANEPFLTIKATYQDSKTLETFPIHLFFSKSDNSFLGVIGFSKEESTPFMFDLEVGDKILISRYILNEKEFTTEKIYHKSITINNLNFNLEKINDPETNNVVIFVRDMANNRIIKKI